MIKAAQRLGFSLDEVSDLLTAAAHRHNGGRRLQAPTPAKVEEIDKKIADLRVIRETLVAALDAGCDDLLECADSECCPIPFVQIATRSDASTR